MDTSVTVIGMLLLATPQTADNKLSLLMTVPSNKCLLSKFVLVFEQAMRIQYMFKHCKDVSMERLTGKGVT